MNSTGSQTVTDGDLRAQLARLTATSDDTIAVAGSVSLVRWLIQEQLLDELEVLIHPIVLGKREQSFPVGPGIPSTTFDLAQSTTVATGVVDLTYRRPELVTKSANDNHRN